jgi:hypothetical protein
MSIIEKALTSSERTARRLLNEDCRSASAAGKTLNQYRRWREDEIARWVDFLHAKMDELHADDPGEVLPQLAIAIEERCLAETRKVAKEVATQVIQSMLRKCLT